MVGARLGGDEGGGGNTGATRGEHGGNTGGANEGREWGKDKEEVLGEGWVERRVTGGGWSEDGQIVVFVHSSCIFIHSCVWVVPSLTSSFTFISNRVHCGVSKVKTI